MRYIGAKYRIRKPLVSFLSKYIENSNCFAEIFCGSLNLTLEIFESMQFWKPKQLIINDIHTDLMKMWQAVIHEGWIPPDNCTKEHYEELRNAESSAERGFIGHSCSFGGIWFSQYAQDNGEKEIIIKPKDYSNENLMFDIDEFGEEPDPIIQIKEKRNYCLNGKNSVMKVADLLKKSGADIKVYNLSYEQVSIPDGALVYCDPPYKNTCKPGMGNDFDHEKFWQWVRELSSRCQVFTSEYTAPEDFECVKEISVSLDMGKRENRVERLFKYRN